MPGKRKSGSHRKSLNYISLAEFQKKIEVARMEGAEAEAKEGAGEEANDKIKGEAKNEPEQVGPMEYRTIPNTSSVLKSASSRIPTLRAVDQSKKADHNFLSCEHHQLVHRGTFHEQPISKGSNGHVQLQVSPIPSEGPQRFFDSDAAELDKLIRDKLPVQSECEVSREYFYALNGLQLSCEGSIESCQGNQETALNQGTIQVSKPNGSGPSLEDSSLMTNKNSPVCSGNLWVTNSNPSTLAFMIHFNRPIDPLRFEYNSFNVTAIGEHDLSVVFDQYFSQQGSRPKLAHACFREISLSTMDLGVSYCYKMAKMTSIKVNETQWWRNKGIRAVHLVCMNSLHGIECSKASKYLWDLAIPETSWKLEKDLWGPGSYDVSASVGSVEEVRWWRKEK